MNLIKNYPELIDLINELEQAYIPMIELLIICLNDQTDSDFNQLYVMGIQILCNVLKRKEFDLNIRQKYCLGGINNLLMMALERHYIPLNLIINLVKPFGRYFSCTIIQICEKCGLYNNALKLLSKQDSLIMKEQIYSIFIQTGHYLSQTTLSAAFDQIQSLDMIDIHLNMPINQRYFERQLIGTHLICKFFIE